MTKEDLLGMGLSEEDSALLTERWDVREREHAAELETLRGELEQPFRAAGLTPGEGRDGLPEADGFMAGFITN